MATTTVRANLVGMRFYGLTRNDAIALLEEDAVMLREPNNPHDRYAIAITSSGRKLGHIDRKSAKNIAPLLDKKCNWWIIIDETRGQGDSSVPLIIELEIHQSPNAEKIRCPNICKANTVGIYRLFVPWAKEINYIGQSMDIQNRVSQHWMDLSKGTHANRNLQELWWDFGAHKFRAKVLERSPKDLRGIELKRWLLDRERAWIKEFGGLRRTLNVKHPEGVLDKNMKERLRNWKLLIEPRIERAQIWRNSISRDIENARLSIRQREEVVRKLSGFWRRSIFQNAKLDCDIAKDEIESLINALNTMELLKSHIDKHIAKLKRSIFID